VNVGLSLLSREKLIRFREELGIDPQYRQCGYLFLARERAELDALLAAQNVQKAAGLREAQRVSPSDILRLNPAIHPDALIGGVFCPTDGFMRPLQILRGYTDRAERLGVRFEYGLPVTGFRMIGPNRIAAVCTPKGEAVAGCVVNAAGAWAGRVAQYAGIEIPVEPLRRQVAVTYPTDLLPENMPMTVFVDDGFHLRVRDGRVLLLWPDVPRVSDPFDTTFADEWLEEVISRAHACVPCLKQVDIDREKCWAGLYEMSPDKHALLGQAPGVENLYLVNGSSGHGVMHSPALGQLLSEIILDGNAKTLDVHALRPSRFTEGRPNFASDVL